MNATRVNDEPREEPVCKSILVRGQTGETNGWTVPLLTTSFMPAHCPSTRCCPSTLTLWNHWYKLQGPEELGLRINYTFGASPTHKDVEWRLPWLNTAGSQSAGLV